MDSIIPAGNAGVMFEAADMEIRQLNRNFDENNTPTVSERSFIVNRPVYTQQEFDEKHGSKPVRRSLLQRCKERLLEINVGQHCMLGVAKSVFPVYNIMRKYDVKEWLINDIIAGLTVGIMHIPQSMAYAMLASMPPVNGLYTSFFPVVIYFIFGTSRHLSLGTIAIVSLLMGTLIDREIGLLNKMTGNANVTNQIGFNLSDAYADNGTAADDFQNSDNYYRAALASATCLLVGIIQLLMGIFRLGFFTRYLSDPLISGFTVGAGFVVFTSQVKYVFGLTVPRQSGVFAVPKTYFEVIKRIPQANVVTLCISAVCIIILYIFKEYINPRVRKKIKAPVPIELFIVIGGTLLSYALDLSNTANVKIVGDIPSGFPRPQVPDLTLVLSDFGEVFSIAVIAFSVCLSLAKIFGKKHGYEVDASQELVAYGLSNCFSSFFQCWPAASSVSRSAVQESMGGKTQLAGVVSSILLTFVLLFIGPYFRTVPNCCLSAIILVALKSIFVQAFDVKDLWKLSIYDFWTWVLACGGVIILSVDLGLIIGIAFSVFSIILRTQAPSNSILGRIVDTDLYKNVRAYEDAEEIQGVKIYRYEGSMYFACAEHFKENIIHATGVNPRKLSTMRKKLKDKRAREKKKREAERLLNEKKNGIQNEMGSNTELHKRTSVLIDSEDDIALLEDPRYPQCDIHHIIIDSSTWGYMDYVGVRVLSQVIEDYREVGVNVFLANPKAGIRELLERSDFYTKHQRSLIYVSVHDAVVAALYFYNKKKAGRRTLKAHNQTSATLVDEKINNEENKDDERQSIGDQPM